MIGREQWWLPITLIATMLMTCAASAALAPTIMAAYSQQEIAYFQRSNSVYLHNAGYFDDADYVLLDQILTDDHSRGGVYFIGDSQSRAGIMTWALPEEEQRLIHNYSLGDLRHRQLRYFIRLLVEECGLLDGGGENTTIVLGLSYYQTRPRDYDDRGYVGAAFERHGFYTYDRGRVDRVRMAPAEHFIRMQREYATRALEILFHTQPSRVRLHSPDVQTVESRALNDRWPDAMREEVQELTELLDYLQSRHVRVEAIFRPSGSWDDNSPYEAAYRTLVEPLLAARGIPLTDQGDVLPDADFGDGEHANYRGQLQLHQIDHALALRALEQMGLHVNGAQTPG